MSSAVRFLVLQLTSAFLLRYLAAFEMVSCKSYKILGLYNTFC